MRVTVLGCGAAAPRAGGALSGYLVRGGGVNLWADAGNGTLANLLRHVPSLDIDALVLTHRHADHISDVIPLMYARTLHTRLRPPLPTYAPPDVFPRLVGLLGETSSQLISAAFDLQPLEHGFDVGGLRVEPFPTVHPVETYGLRITDGSRTLVYTADTAMFPELPERCRQADLLVCEATNVDGMDSPPGIHLYAREAGAVAAAADARRVVLTHIWPSIDPARSAAEARQTYDGPLEAALEGATYTL